MSETEELKMTVNDAASAEVAMTDCCKTTSSAGTADCCKITSSAGTADCCKSASSDGTVDPCMAGKSGSGTVNIVLCGVGGQGTILASRLIASAAMKAGIPVKSAETIGMAQRGGSVFSHLRLGEDAGSPRIGLGQADVIIGFEPAETVRMLPFLKEGGTVVASSAPVMPVSAMIGASSYPLEDILAYLKENVPALTLVDSKKAAEDLGSSKCLNVVLLGAALRTGRLALKKEDVICALKEALPEKLHEMNCKALDYIS